MLSQGAWLLDCLSGPAVRVRSKAVYAWETQLQANVRAAAAEPDKGCVKIP